MTEPCHGDREDEEILTLARGGDRTAFGALCERHRLRIWRVAASVARRREDADDLAQVAIVRAFQSLTTFRGETSFEAWLCRIALNAAHDYHRSAWRRRVVLWGQNRSDSDARDCGNDVANAGTTPGPHEETERREVQRRVRAAVAALGARERVPIWLVYLEDFTVAEVARLERVPESTIRSRVKVGLRRLERPLRDLEFPEPDTFFEDGARPSVSPIVSVAARPSGHDLKGFST